MVERVEHVVAGHRGYLDVRMPSRAAMATIGLGRGERVRRAEVADELRAGAREHRQQRLDARREPLVVAGARVAAAPQLRERDRALGEALEDQVVERAVRGEMHGRIEAVAGEPGAAAESQRPAHRSAIAAHSGSMPAFLMIAFHLSDSTAWNFARSAGDVVNGSVPVTR